MKNLNNRAKLLIAFALIVVIAVAAMIVSNLNQKDEGPALPSPLGVSVSLHMNEEGLNSLFSGSGDTAPESFRQTLGTVSALEKQELSALQRDINQRTKKIKNDKAMLKQHNAQIRSAQKSITEAKRKAAAAKKTAKASQSRLKEAQKAHKAMEKMAK